MCGPHVLPRLGGRGAAGVGDRVPQSLVHSVLWSVWSGRDPGMARGRGGKGARTLGGDWGESAQVTLLPAQGDRTKESLRAVRLRRHSGGPSWPPAGGIQVILQTAGRGCFLLMLSSSSLLAFSS